jgi:hypothetical protein
VTVRLVGVFAHPDYRLPQWAAILRHQTQLPEHERIPAPLRWLVLDAECFVRAFPARAPGEPVLGDLLAGLS